MSKVLGPFMDGPNIFKEVCEHPETHRDAGDDNDELGNDDDEAEAVPISVTPTVESDSFEIDPDVNLDAAILLDFLDPSPSVSESNGIASDLEEKTDEEESEGDEEELNWG